MNNTPRLFHTLLLLLSAVTLVLPAIGYAQEQAYTTKSAHLRAGPARDYPVIAIIAPGVPVTVGGCLSSFTWCEVILADSNRGWMYAGNLSYFYNGSNASVLSAGSLIGLGILAFSVGTYWDTHYRGRPWYWERQRWVDRPIRSRPQVRDSPSQPRPPIVHGQPNTPSRSAAVHTPTQPRPPVAHVPDRSRPNAPSSRSDSHSPNADRGERRTARDGR